MRIDRKRLETSIEELGAIGATPRGGLTRLALGDRAGAAAAFRESLRLDPQQVDIARTLAEVRRGGEERSPPRR